jgi:hypothetical protein
VDHEVSEREERSRDGITGGPRNKLRRRACLSIGAEGANGGDGKGNVTNTHTGGGGRRRAEVVDSGLTGNSVVVGETGGVGVESGDGRGAGRVNGLNNVNVNDDERCTTIEIKDRDVWLLRQAGAITVHDFVLLIDSKEKGWRE